jgi:hypothetical protein
MQRTRVGHTALHVAAAAASGGGGGGSTVEVVAWLMEQLATFSDADGVNLRDRHGVRGGVSILCAVHFD